MSYKKKKEELEAPDAFQRKGNELSEWLMGKQKLFFAVVVLALAIFLVMTVIRSMGHKKEVVAEQALTTALDVVSRPVQAKPADGPGDDQAFATEKDKDEAIVKSLEAFRQKYPGSGAAATAALTLGQAQLRLGQYDQALANFNEFLTKRPATDVLRPIALEGKGYAYEAKNQLDQALAAFAELSDSKSGLLSGMGLYHQARIFILEQKKDEAAKVLSRIPIEYPDTAAAKLAKERLDSLLAQGVKAPSTAGTPAVAAPGKGS